MGHDEGTWIALMTKGLTYSYLRCTVALLKVGIEINDRYGLLTPAADSCATGMKDSLLHNFFLPSSFYMNNGDVIMQAPRFISGTLCSEHYTYSRSADIKLLNDMYNLINWNPNIRTLP